VKRITLRTWEGNEMRRARRKGGRESQKRKDSKEISTLDTSFLYLRNLGSEIIVVEPGKGFSWTVPR
jgi:hypothetical protein